MSANLYINAPDTMSAGRSRTYTTEAGEATLVLEARDSTSGALLGRVLRPPRDTPVRRRAVDDQRLEPGGFLAAVQTWANICVKGFEELKAHSPVPADLQPNQKL